MNIHQICFLSNIIIFIIISICITIEIRAEDEKIKTVALYLSLVLHIADMIIDFVGFKALPKNNEVQGNAVGPGVNMNNPPNTVNVSNIDVGRTPAFITRNNPIGPGVA